MKIALLTIITIILKLRINKTTINTKITIIAIIVIRIMN